MMIVNRELTTENNASVYEGNNCEIAEIGDFKQLVKSASTAAAGLPLSDLPKAFQLSFGLIEKVSDLMLSALTPTKNESFDSVGCSDSSTPDCSLFYSDNERMNSPRSSAILKENQIGHAISSRTVTAKPIESKRLDFDSIKLDVDISTKASKPESRCLVDSENLDSNGLHNQINQLRPHSSRSSTSSSLASTGPQPCPEPATPDDNETVSTTNSMSLDDASTMKYGSKATETKTEEEILLEVATDLPDKRTLELRAHKTLRHLPSVFGSNHTSNSCEFGLGLRNPTDLRRWRLTSTDRLNTLIDECERQINGRKLYVCKFCGKVYEIKSSMRYHMKIIHLQMHLRTTEMQCRICGKQFTCVSAVNRHQSKCMLSTYTETGMPRSKHYTFSLSGTTGLSAPFPEVQTTNCSSSLIASETLTVAGSLNEVRSSEDNANPLRQHSAINSALYDTIQPSDRLTPSGDSTHPTVSKSICPSDSYSLLDSSVNANGTSNCCFPAACHLRSYNCPIPSDLIADSYCNPGSNPLPWSAFPNLGYNLSDLSPVQLEMCMKAMVRGINSNINGVNLSGSVSAAESSTCMPEASLTSENSNRTILQRSSFSSIQTNRSPELSNAEQTFGISKPDDVAMDLSARSNPDSIMIESYS